MNMFGWAWLAATLALALHVADEATHDFLGWYNPRVQRIRRALGGLPFPPTFTFVPWLAGLVAAVLLLSALAPAAFAGRAWMRPLGYGVASIHIANGLLHIGAALVARRRVPGVLSAPLLVAVGGWLAQAATRLSGTG